MKPTALSLISVLRGKGFRVYERPFELNIVGIRNANISSNRFDDVFFVFWKDDAGTLQQRSYPCTTDPGTFWLNNPKQPQGTAFLKGGQYPNAYCIGLHQGKYKALVEKAPVTIVRGLSRGAGIDWNGGQSVSGNFGINIHRANRSGTTLTVDRNSAGCQVLAKAEDFAELMTLCEVHQNRYGNSFTYTLIDFRAIADNRAIKYGLAALLLGSLWAFAGDFFEGEHEEDGNYESDREHEGEKRKKMHESLDGIGKKKKKKKLKKSTDLLTH